MSLNRMLVDFDIKHDRMAFMIYGGQLRLERVSHSAEGDVWVVEVGTDRGNAIGLHRKSFAYNANNNPLSLLKAALDALDEEVFEDGFGSSDLEWGQSRARGEIQGG